MTFAVPMNMQTPLPAMQPGIAGMRAPLPIRMPMVPPMQQGMVPPMTQQGIVPQSMNHPMTQQGILQQPAMPAMQQQTNFPGFANSDEYVIIEDEIDFHSTYNSMNKGFVDCSMYCLFV